MPNNEGFKFPTELYVTRVIDDIDSDGDLDNGQPIIEYDEHECIASSNPQRIGQYFEDDWTIPEDKRFIAVYELKKVGRARISTEIEPLQGKPKRK